MKIISLLIIVFCCNTANSVELTNNETVSFVLDGNSLSTELYIDVPANANSMKVEIMNGIIGSDFDLFMKFDSDFTSNTFIDLEAETDYYSAGSDAHEFFTISSTLPTPLRAGRWYIGVFNFNAIAQTINLTVSYNSEPLTKPTIDFIFDQNTIVGTDTPCEIEGWSDTTPFTPQSGNNATTLGEARKIAALRAAELMTENLQSTVPLVIQGCWPTDLDSSEDSVTLASARANNLSQNTPGLVKDTWYPITTATRLAGTQACKLFGGDCSAPTIIINFNPLVDTSQALGTIHWFYGVDSSIPRRNVDFVSTALHEMIHGLGFTSSITLSEGDIQCPQGVISHTVGTLLCNQKDIYSSYLATVDTNNTLTPLVDLPSDFDRKIAMTSETNLLWNSELVKNSEFNTLINNNTGFAQLYAPFEISEGSSVSHLSRSYNELMEPFQDDNLRTLGLATPILWDIGWDPRPKLAKAIQAGFYYDPSHDGHGFVIEPISDNLYFVVFYTYKDDGTPQWFTSLSTLENNVLNINMDNDTLQTVNYDFNVDPTGAGNPLIVDNSIANNKLKIDFNSSSVASNAACTDGTPRTEDVALASWELGNTSGDWCIIPLFGSAPNPDFGGTWWTGVDDDGWGMSMAFTGDLLFITVYYYDADGKPRWALGIQDGFSIGQPLNIDMQEFTGYGRTATPIDRTSVSAGSMTLTLNSKTGNGSDGTLNLDINYQGIEGGNWQRTNVPVTIFTEPH